MRDILDRLYHVARVYGLENSSVIKRLLKNRCSIFSREFRDEDFDRIWEKFDSSFNNQEEEPADSGHQETGPGNRNQYESGDREETCSAMPAQFVEYLALFNLTPPSSLEEVRKARNREIKKYHSDKFMNNQEKLETSKKIMQIYNTAFDRLKEYYK